VHPPLFFVHSLVSRSYVFDLAPGNSFVEAMLARGFDVFLTQWGAPDELEAGYTLETYCDELLPEMVDAVLDVTGADDVHVFGYCFGGLLSLLYAAGHPDDPIRSLAVMATPVDFTQMGAMTLMFRVGGVDPEALLDQTGNVPADAVRSSFRLIQPTADVAAYVNLWQHLWDDDYLRSHQAMTGWAQDHIPFAGACFVQVAEHLGKGNELVTGRLPLGDRTIDLADLRVPVLSILGEKDTIVPPASTDVLLPLVGSEEKDELRLPAGHVGLIVGRSAQQRHIPAMAAWLERHSEEA
jgi:polyhydroxyalkanoate synthase